MSSLYEILSSLLERKGVSGYRMCTDLGISPSLMTDLKSGRKKTVNAKTAQKIADYFGVSTSYLLGEKEKPTIQMDSELREVVETYVERPDMKVLFHSAKELSEEDLRAALAIIKFLKQKE